MLAYHNDPSLKTFVLGQLALHRKADKLLKGAYWENGKGCAVGCTIEAVRLHNGNAAEKKLNHKSHALYESELGIPRVLARLEDIFFEALPNGESQAWPERFTSAIMPGADLTMIWPRFALWLLTEEVPPRTKNEGSLASLAEVGALYREWIDGAKPGVERWMSARTTAADAATAGAGAAAAAAAADAADAAARAAAAATYAAAYAAARADAAARAAAAATYAAARAADAAAARAAGLAGAAAAYAAARAADTADTAAAAATYAAARAADAAAARAADTAGAAGADAAARAAGLAGAAAAYAAARAADTADRAADTADRADAAAYARNASYRRQSDKLIDLLQATVT